MAPTDCSMQGCHRTLIGKKENKPLKSKTHSTRPPNIVSAEDRKTRDTHSGHQNTASPHDLRDSPPAPEWGRWKNSQKRGLLKDLKSPLPWESDTGRQGRLPAGGGRGVLPAEAAAPPCGVIPSSAPSVTQTEQCHRRPDSSVTVALAAKCPSTHLSTGSGQCVCPVGHAIPPR